MPLSAGGTRPEPAVSVATANGTSPVATASADPELDPPEIRFAAEHAARHRVRRAGAVQPGGELVEVGLADVDRARRRAAAHHRRGGGRLVGVVRAGQRGRHPGDVDAVLDPERHAVQRQRRRIRLAARARWPAADQFGRGRRR